MSSIIRATTTSGLQVAPDNSGSLQLQTNGTTAAVTIDTSQNVGIGTTSPSSKLQVEGNFLSATGLLVKDTTSGSGLSSYFNASNYTDADCIIKVSQVGATTKYVSIGPSVSIPLTFRTADTERMRIDSSGNVFVGTTTVPATGAGTNSTIVSNKDYSGAFAQIINSSSTTGTQFFIEFGRGASECGKITSTATNSTTYATSSDYRLKENVQPMVGALDTVSQLKPVTYTWKVDGTSGQGFIAHELQAIIPEAVVGEKDELNEDGSIRAQAIDTSFLVATLTAAIQEQQTIINDLKARIETLESK